MSRERSALVKNLAAVADFEIGPAAAVDPDEIPRVAPGLPVRIKRTPRLVFTLQLFRRVSSDEQLTTVTPGRFGGAQLFPPIVKSARHPRSTQIPRRSQPQLEPKMHGELLRCRASDTPPLASVAQKLRRPSSDEQ
jgi:hypothetical protein